ncbi:MAG: transcription antitermination factor NusB [Pseudomonadota bacterium]
MSARPSRRRAAREVALQALYAWQLAGGDAAAHAEALEGWARCDQAFAAELVRGVAAAREALEARIAPHLDRPIGALSPIERVLLLMGAWELAERPDTPFRVVLNEAVELGKLYGGTDGYKFVNGVLEKLAAEVRPAEVARLRTTA